MKWRDVIEFASNEFRGSHKYPESWSTLWQDFFDKQLPAISIISVDQKWFRHMKSLSKIERLMYDIED